MSDPTFSKEQIAALEKILGVKLPEQGFTLEIKAIGPTPLGDADLGEVVGGSGGDVARPMPAPTPSAPVQLPSVRWTCKI